MKVRFMFDVFVDGRFVARDGGSLPVRDGATTVETLQACLKMADQLCWVVADLALDSREKLTRDRVSYVVRDFRTRPTKAQFDATSPTKKL